jgi:hypothetical protein
LDPREVFKEWNGHLLHEHVNLCFRPVFPERPKRGNHDGDVTELLELDGQDFHLAGVMKPEVQMYKNLPLIRQALVMAC